MAKDNGKDKELMVYLPEKGQGGEVKLFIPESDTGDAIHGVFDRRNNKYIGKAIMHASLPHHPQRIEWRDALVHLLARAFNGLVEPEKGQIAQELRDWFEERDQKVSDSMLRKMENTILDETEKLGRTGG
ncbi:hypothetical protein ABIA24_001963 [Sinorhizobium fredii]|uniref:hypothetical protein n=1 Tax=Rhizobium fredii TaxID=380 RepID=UPI0030A9AF78